MLLRSTLEKVLPLDKGEKHLSPAARSFVFRGFYLPPREITDVETRLNPNVQTKREYSAAGSYVNVPASEYHYVVIREGIFGGEHESGDGIFARSYENPGNYIANEIGWGAMSRANRVESFARRLKVSAAVLLAAGAAAFGAIEKPDLSIHLPFGAQDNGALISAPLGEAMPPYEAPQTP